MNTDLQAALEASVERMTALADSKRALQNLQQYAALLLERNRSINLVSRKDTEMHLARFIDESSILASLLESDRKRLNLGDDEVPYLLDIGTGGGFPGLILKVLLPDVETVLIDATQKKAKFVAEACEAMDLTGVSVIWGRAEDMANPKKGMKRPELRHAFDWVTTKALGSLKDSTALAVHFMDEGSVHWTFKGASLRQEMKQARRLMAQARLEEYVVKRISEERESYLVGLRRIRS